jgi:hypothetical protein
MDKQLMEVGQALRLHHQTVQRAVAEGRKVQIDVPDIPIVDFREAQDAVRGSPYDESRHPLPMCSAVGKPQFEACRAKSFKSIPGGRLQLLRCGGFEMDRA